MADQLTPGGSADAARYVDWIGADAVEFGRAMEAYRTLRHRRFPACSEVLRVLKSLGYRKVEPAGPLPEITRPPSNEPGEGWRDAATD
jgi:hypothetical protein